MIRYVVIQGDCLSSIAKHHGFLWPDLWNLPENAELRAKRKSPDILYPDDIVWVPVKEEMWVDRPTGATHRFQKPGRPHVVRLRLLWDGVPRPGLPCTMNIDGRPVEVVTDGDGKIETWVEADAKECVLWVHAPAGKETYHIDLGHLDPIDTVEGVQERLTNLGYDCGPIDGKDGPKTKAGVRAFQKDAKIVVDGVAGPITKGKLVEAHGS